MKHAFFSTALATTLIALAPAAQALEITGGSVSLTYGRYLSPPGDSIVLLDGAVALDFGNGFGGQIDASIDKIGGGSPDTQIGAHVFRAFSPSLTAGIYATYERNALAFPYSSFGVEAKIDPVSASAMPISLEFAAGVTRDILFAAGYWMVSAKATYTLNNAWDMSAKFASFQDVSSPYNAVTLSASRSFGEGMRVTGFYDTRVYPGASNEGRVGLMLTRDFGAGRTFDSRSIMNAFFGF